MAITVGTSTATSANAGSTPTLVINANVLAGDLLLLCVTVRDSTTDPTVDDNDSGTHNAWAKFTNQNAATNGAGSIWYKFATAATASKTITVTAPAGYGSCGATVTPFRGVSRTRPFADTTAVSEANAAANETQAQINVGIANSEVLLAIFCTSNDIEDYASMAATDPASLPIIIYGESTTGSDCSVQLNGALKTTAGVTGAFTWTQTDGTGASIAFAIAPELSPTVALNTPNDDATSVSTTPDLVFTGTDANADEIEYNVQVDTVNTFDGRIDGFAADHTSALPLPTYDANSQSFTGNGNKIGSLSVSLYKSAGATGTIQIDIYAMSGTWGSNNNLPTGVALATSSTVDITTLATAPGNYISFIFSGANQITLTNGTHYVAVLSGSSITGSVSWWLDVVGTGYSGNAAYKFSGSWTAQTRDYDFAVYATPAPLLSKFSVTPDATFAGTGDPHPWPSGNQVTYTVQAGNILTANTKYYWRVAGTDPSGSATYGAWSPGAHTGYSEFTTAAAGSGPANLKSRSGNLKANIKSMSGNLIANIKSLSGNS